ncbi:MAG: hypothetical protein U9R16_07650 [Campylobacterota bacterium]|nr:hypothetical protein [Campylobacterota bacterium]
MNSKKSIVLLITIFFISAISVLILQNLDDTDQYLDETKSQNMIAQTQITIQNIKEEIPKYLKKNKENIDEILENTENIPLKFGNVDIKLSIQEYELPLFDINNLTKQIKDSDEFVNNITNQYDFLEIIKQNKYTNQKQIDQSINEYIKLTRDKNILNIKDMFTYIKADEKSRFIKCNCDIKVGDETSKFLFIFDLNKKDTVLELFSYN